MSSSFYCFASMMPTISNVPYGDPDRAYLLYLFRLPTGEISQLSLMNRSLLSNLVYGFIRECFIFSFTASFLGGSLRSSHFLVSFILGFHCQLIVLF